MAKNKTTETQASVPDFLATITDDKRRNDCLIIINLISNHTKLEPKMWGAAIVGFGSYHYKYESGHEGTAPLVGLASRAKAISLYIPVFEGREVLLSKFGKHKTGKGCIYVQKLEDIDTAILTEMATKGMEHTQKKYTGDL